MAKEAEMMCAWMSKTNKPVDFYGDDDIPDEIVESRIVWYRSLNVMINILAESSSADGHKSDKEGPASRNCPGGDGNCTTADGAANITEYGCSICFFCFVHAAICVFKRISLALLHDKHSDTILFTVLSPGVAFQMY
jgi:hypothetical protein